MGAVGRAGGCRTGPDLTLSSAFLATQHLATPSSTCTCPRRFPISVMMLMAESYLGKAVCTARWGVGSGWARTPHLPPHIPITSPPGPHGSGGCQQSRAGRVPVVAGPHAAVRSSWTPVREACDSGLLICHPPLGRPHPVGPSDGQPRDHQHLQSPIHPSRCSGPMHRTSETSQHPAKCKLRLRKQK